jgi:hypothetical protein
VEEKHNMARCKQCDHLLSFHGEDGCGTWLLGVRAVPLYRCACVVSVTARPKTFPTISTHSHEAPAVAESKPPDEMKARIANLRPASEAAPLSTRDRLIDVASELRRTAEELKELETMLDKALTRFHAIDKAPPEKTMHSASETADERRDRRERRQRHYAMIADRRVGNRRNPQLV